MSSDAAYGDPETRQRILTVTRQLVAEKGAALSLKDVAAQAGVSRQSVYLHFGDRTGLLVGLVQHMDDELALGNSMGWIFEAESGAEVIERTMRTHAEFSAAIDGVALILEAAQYDDEALGAAWRDRMRFRHYGHRAIVERIAAMGDLADEWTVETAGDLFYAVTLVNPWRELTRELGWSNDEYVAHMTHLVCRALLAG